MKHLIDLSNNREPSSLQDGCSSTDITVRTDQEGMIVVLGSYRCLYWMLRYNAISASCNIVFSGRLERAWYGTKREMCACTLGQCAQNCQAAPWSGDTLYTGVARCSKPFRKVGTGFILLNTNLVQIEKLFDATHVTPWNSLFRDRLRDKVRRNVHSLTILEGGVNQTKGYKLIEIQTAFHPSFYIILLHVYAVVSLPTTYF